MATALVEHSTRIGELMPHGKERLSLAWHTIGVRLS